MVWLFWAAVILVFYSYAGYPAFLYVLGRLRPRPIAAASVFPSVSIVIAARDEEKNIARKLANLSEVDYPIEQIEVIVVSDGSVDGTNDVLKSHSQVRAIFLEKHVGKATALNAGVQMARNPIVVFTDARQALEPGSLKALLSNFSDPAVGCVSGELMLAEPENPATMEGIGLYWKIEKVVRQLESRTGSTVGVTGAFYAARKELLVPLPAHTILDDVYTPMHVAKAGYRVVFEPKALAWDVPVASAGLEFKRKVRTLTGNYQLILLAPWMLGPGNPILLKFISHKMLRLLGPLALTAIFLSSMAVPGVFYKAVFFAQVAFYLVAILALCGIKPAPLRRLSSAASSFVVLNAAALLALVNLLRGKMDVWAR